MYVRTRGRSTCNTRSLQIRKPSQVTICGVTEGCQMVCFKTKMPIWAYFGRPLNYKMLVYLTAIWYNVWQFGVVCGPLVFFPFWYFLTKKNLATLVCLAFIFCELRFVVAKYIQ
jgi:hypothetical protein